MDKYERFEEAERKLTERGLRLWLLFRPSTALVCLSLDDFETLVWRVTELQRALYGERGV